MGRVEGEPPLPNTSPARIVRYTDAEGRATDDPAAAVSGEAVLYDEHGMPRRTLFVFAQRELPWLPIGEAAFLLWVLVILMMIWLVIGLVLYLT